VILRAPDRTQVRMSERELNETESTSRLNIGPDLGDSGASSMDTTRDKDVVRPSDVVTRDPLDQLGLAGKLSFERVGTRLGFDLDDEVKPQRIARFSVRETLGEGGMGVVFLAHDPDLEREIAVKLIQTRRHLSPTTLRKRLIREGRALGQLRHPNVVQVHELGEHDGELYLAMEYVAGHTLRAWQDQRPRARDEILHAYTDAGRGLAAAHAASIVHRDFKPENVLISADGRVQVTDFGLADLLSALVDESTTEDTTPGQGHSYRLTNAGEILGTLGYMAPEQLRGESADARSDQFSFCVALWEALTRQPPFAGNSRDERLASVVEGGPVGADMLPRWLRRLLRRGLANNPSQRHPDMTSLVDALAHGRMRGRRWLFGGVLSGAVLITISSLGYAIVSRPPTAAPCELVLKLGESPDWRPLRERLGPDAQRLDDLARRLSSLEAHAASLCRVPARRDHAVSWLADLHRLLASPPNRDLEQILDHVDWLLERSWSDAPRRPITDTVSSALARADALEFEGKLDDALDEIDRALAASVWAVDLAEAQLRRGRLLTLQGNYADAWNDYGDAAANADADADDSVRLQASLRAAELALKRLDRLDFANAKLVEIEGVFRRINEPPLSERRAQYHNLRATLSLHQGDEDRALREQLRALVLLATRQASPHLLARALASLGSIYEERGNLAMAERCYRFALERVPGPNPDRRQVELMLGDLLAEYAPERRQEARMLLQHASEGRPELRLAALTQLLRLALSDDDPIEASIETLADALARQLKIPGGSERHRYEARQTLAFVFAADPPPSARFEQAVAQTYDLAPSQDDSLGIAAFDLTIAEMSFDDEQTRVYAKKSCVRLESLEPSEDRNAMLERCTARLDELSH
jgi:serine/threonine protein kinase